ncbi:hypothetical protein PORY_001734 [Pneumocystis oryctolagi]|uniref:Uncharacterized protein n=1 Tax=Pneumocystis oryctolagi TaxID=42067 RepID=A0ACB7CHX8_9ASCO|nr:hypothetical protein PORY_001734 [Pneumocystis oryctolagi]
MYGCLNQNKSENSLGLISSTNSTILIVQRDFIVRAVENKPCLSGSVLYLEPFLEITTYNIEIISDQFQSGSTSFSNCEKGSLLDGTFGDSGCFFEKNKTCSICMGEISDKFIKTRGIIIHPECFKCYDCHKILVSDFFLINDPEENGQQYLCETDYFRRFDLLCTSCGKALKGIYIMALNKKYHIEHFTCSICSATFSPDDSYYVHKGNTYCYFHYCTNIGIKCNGCRFIISKQFTEILRNGRNENWHVGCYVIYKFWKIKLALWEKDLNFVLSLDQLLEKEKDLKEKVYRIWKVLSEFEKSFMACINNILLHISDSSYIDEIIGAEKIVEHVEILFFALDQLELSFHEFNQKLVILYNKVKMFFRKIVCFFFQLLTTWKLRIQGLGATYNFFSLTSGLSRYLKYLTRLSLIGALQLVSEKDSINPTAVYDFLDCLDRLNLNMKLTDGLDNKEALFETLLSVKYNDITSYICMICQKSIEGKCVRIDNKRCHMYCLKCFKCNKSMEQEPNDARWNKSSESILCLKCATNDSCEEFLQVTEYSQYIFLLRVILLRLYVVFRNGSIIPHLSNISQLEIRSFWNQKGFFSICDSFQAKLFNNDKIYFRILEDIEKLYELYLNSEAFDKDSDFSNIDNIKASDTNEDEIKYKLNTFPYECLNDSLMNSKLKVELKNISEISTPRFNKELMSSNSIETKLYLSSLSILETFFIKHVAILLIEPLVRDFFSSDELLDIVRPKKKGFFGKFAKAIKSINDDKKRYKKKVFGVPLETLVEENGVNSEHGMVPGCLYIPEFIDEIISAMKQMDVSVEGIFRKNGNIKKLNDFTESIDSNFNNISFDNESPIQLAALLKKFLRELPEPLLTFKLHKLFLASQKIDDENIRHRVLHLTCCLLPKCHLNCMEAIFLFLNWVASFAEVNEESGNKMDVYNLATVITPDILYSKNREAKVDEAILAIKVVYTLIEFIDKFSLVPTDLLSILHDSRVLIENQDLSVEDMLEEYEKILEINSLKNEKLSPIKKFTILDIMNIKHSDQKTNVDAI